MDALPVAGAVAEAHSPPDSAVHAMQASRVALVCVVLLLIAGFFLLGLDRTLTLAALNDQLAAIVAYRELHPWSVAPLYVGIYARVAALSIPTAAVLTLVGGAIFGVVWGTLLAASAASAASGRRAHTPAWALRLAKRYLAWQVS